MKKNNLRTVISAYSMPSDADYALALAGNVRVVTVGGIDLPCRVAVWQRATLQEAQKRGYIITSKTRLDEPLANAFSVWCFMRRRPFPIARVRGKYAQVSVDFVEIPRQMQPSDATQAEANRFLATLARRPGWSKRAQVDISGAYWNVAPVPLALANEAIRGLASIATRTAEGGEA